MKDEKENLSIGEKLRQAIKESNEQSQQNLQQNNTGIKATMYIAGALILLWSSKYLLSALAGVIRSFKELRKSIREK